MKQLSDYTIVIQHNGPGFVAWIPAIDGCYALGDTQLLAFAELELVFTMFDEDEMPDDVADVVAVPAAADEARTPTKEVAIPVAS